MKNNDNCKIAQLLYNQSANSEVYPDILEGESLAIHRMLSEIRAIGYEWYYFSDIKFRKIKDPRIMQILLKYYPDMESIYTKEDILRQIDPKSFPVVINLALTEYNSLSPMEKKDISGFQNVLSKGAMSSEYISLLLSLLSDPDNYAASFLIRKKLAQIVPERLRELSFFYSQGVLLVDTLKEFAKYADKESIQLLNWAININENEVEQLYNNQSYHLCVTMYEYWKSCCTKQNIRYEAKKLLSKIKDQ